MKRHVRILRLALPLMAAAAVLAFTDGCSNFLLGIVQSFGTPNGPKISTIAGNGTGGYSGDGGPAISAELHQPYAVTQDSSGNLYIADTVNQVIRMVDTSGNITRVAGTYSQAGYFGDGFSATSAHLNSPLGIAVDSLGNIYIADSANYVIREVSGGNITTVAGTGNHGYSGDGGPPTSANLGYPYDVAADSKTGNLYIADMDNSAIWMVDPTHTTISIVAGKHPPASAGYSGDGYPATSAQLNYPMAVAVDTSGNIYIADSSNYVIRKFTLGGIIITVAGNGINGYSGDGGPATAAEINWPTGIAVDSSGNLYISEPDNSVVRKVDTNGIISTVAGNVHLGAGFAGDDNVATAAMLNQQYGLAIDSSGNLLIADRINNRIRKVAFGK